MRIIVGGVVSRYPMIPGSVWNPLQLATGFRLLGHDVLCVEELDPKMCVDRKGAPCPFEQSVNRDLFAATMTQFALLEDSCQLCRGTSVTTGLSYEALARRSRGADILFNISGHVKADLVLDGVKRRAYLDHDPVYTQLWSAEYGSDLGLDRYDVFFSRGLNIGTPESAVPSGGVAWKPLFPSVVLDHWPTRFDPSTRRFTTIASWGGYGDLSYRGHWYRSKYETFTRFADLPKRVDQTLEIALKARRRDDRIARLEENGWIISDATRISSLAGYQDFIAGSRAEIGIAKGAYVDASSGWFSDRSAHYLASGRPVLHHATGFEHHLPTGEGLMSFGTVAEAAEGITAINRDYRKHCLAARALAGEYLDHRKVLPRLLADSVY